MAVVLLHRILVGALAPNLPRRWRSISGCRRITSCFKTLGAVIEIVLLATEYLMYFFCKVTPQISLITSTTSDKTVA